MATINPFDDISAIVSKHDIFLTQSDLTNQIKSCPINTAIVSSDKIKIKDNYIRYLSENFPSVDEESSFVGFSELLVDKSTSFQVRNKQNLTLLF